MVKPSKPLQVYLNVDQRKDLELLAKAFKEKTLSRTINRLIRIFRTLGVNE